MSDMLNVPQVDLQGNAVGESTEQSTEDAALEQALDLKAEGSEEVSAEEQVEEKEVDPFDSKFAALSRKEKAFRDDSEAKNKALDDKIALLDEKLAKLEEASKEPEPEPVKPLDYRLKRNPLKTLEEQGLDFDTLTNLALNDGKLTPEMQLNLMKEEIEASYEAKFKVLEERLASKDEEALQVRKEQEEQTYNTTLSNFKDEINAFVDDSDSLDLIKEYDAQDQVYEVISAHHKETDRIMDIKEAADYVEEYLLEEARKLANNPKLRERLFGEENNKPVQEKKPSSVTLSNTQSSQIPTESVRYLSNEESLKKAAASLKWND